MPEKRNCFFYVCSKQKKKNEQNSKKKHKHAFVLFFEQTNCEKNRIVFCVFVQKNTKTKEKQKNSKTKTKPNKSQKKKYTNVCCFVLIVVIVVMWHSFHCFNFMQRVMSSMNPSQYIFGLFFFSCHNFQFNVPKTSQKRTVFQTHTQNTSTNTHKTHTNQ